MNSKSSESPGLLVNRNSLLILLPGLLWRCGRPHCPVLLSFFTSYGIKTITVSERHPVDGLNERMWCHSCFVFVGAGSWHWSISLNNTDFVMKSASSGSFKKKERKKFFSSFYFLFFWKDQIVMSIRIEEAHFRSSVCRLNERKKQTQKSNWGRDWNYEAMWSGRLGLAVLRWQLQ